MPATLADIAEKMRKIDICMLTTRTDGGTVASRPMSNNGDVDYDGDSWFFTTEDSRMVTDIARDPSVGLSFRGTSGMLGMTPFFVAASGTGRVIRDKAAFEDHWNPDLERWFADGVDTPGLVLINVRASRLHYWDGEDEGEILIGETA